MLQRSTGPAVLPAWAETAGYDVTVVLEQSEVYLFRDADAGMAHKIPVMPCGSCARPSATQKYLPTTVTVLHLHTSTLSSLSGYFKTLFSTDLGHFCQDCRELTLRMEGHEFEAAHHVLMFMHTSRLPTNNGVVPDGMLLVWMLKVADAWDVQSCIDAIFTKLSGLSASAFPTAGVFALPDSFCSPPVMDKLVKLAKIPLRKVYSDEPYILFLREEQKCMLELPPKAMMALLESDNFRVDSEATVAVHLHAWLLHNGTNLSNQERQEMLGMVRYGLMYAAYIETALPLLSEVGVTPDQAKELLTMIAQKGKCAEKEKKEEEWLALREFCPLNWFAPRSNSGRTAGLEIEIRLRVDNDSLRTHVSKVAHMSSGGPAPKPLSSCDVLAQGYKWTAEMSSFTLATAFAVKVHVCLPSQESSTTVGVNCEIKLSVFKAASHTVLQPWSTHSVTGSVALYPFLCGRWAVGGDDKLEHWKHLLQDGNLCIVIKIKVKA